MFINKLINRNKKIPFTWPYKILLIRQTFPFSYDFAILFLTLYLMNSQEAIVYKNTISVPFKVISVVPQGSNWGPLLLLLFINDITIDIINEYSENMVVFNFTYRL